MGGGGVPIPRRWSRCGASTSPASNKGLGGPAIEWRTYRDRKSGTRRRMRANYRSYLAALPRISLSPNGHPALFGFELIV